MYYTQRVKRIYPSNNFFYRINNPLLIIYTPLKGTSGSPVGVFLFVWNVVTIMPRISVMMTGTTISTKYTYFSEKVYFVEKNDCVNV